MLHDKETRALALIGAQLRLAVNPVVLCSFGKDSIVLLHLCLRFKKVPAIFFRFARFHEKHAHALTVMQQWDLEVYDLWPQTVTDYQHGDFFDVLHGYSMGHDASGRPGTMSLSSGIRARHDSEDRFLCACDDLMGRPRSRDHDYPWDMTFHGHKGTDDPELGTQGDIVDSVSQLGATTLVVPFTDWTDDDIWAYIRKYNLPYDKARYDEQIKATSPDSYPTCFRCLDTRHRGEIVDCPKYEKPLLNIAKPEAVHAAFRQSLIDSFQYCKVTGEPRRTEDLARR